MKKIAAVDVGLKRIGLAFLLNNIAMPVDSILRKNRNQAARDLTKFLKENEISILIVGIPKGGSSSEEMKRRIEHFVSLLEFDGQIYYQDEYASSIEAKEIKKFKDKRDGKLDSLAAYIILQRWYESNIISSKK